MTLSRKDEERAHWNKQPERQTDSETLWAPVGAKSCVRCLSVKTIPRVPLIWVGATSQDPCVTGHLWWDHSRHGTRAKMNDIHQIRMQTVSHCSGRLWLGAQVTSHTGAEAQWSDLFFSLIVYNRHFACWRLLLLLLQLHGTEVAMNFTITRDGTGMKINIGHTCKEPHWPAWSRVTWPAPV